MHTRTLTERWKNVPTTAALDREYDATALAAEVAALRDHPWRPQRSARQDGLGGQSTVDWTILTLRGPGGDPARTDPGGAGLVDHADTPHLSRAPRIAELLRGLPTTLLSVRLMALGPGTGVKEHRDAKCGLPWGLLRLHVPVITNPGAMVVIEGRDHHWDAGRLWFGDFNRPHLVRNDGDAARIHLVVDCLVSRELLGLFPAEFRQALPESDVLVSRPAAAAAEVPAMRFRMPRRFTEWSHEQPEAPADATVAARIVPGPGGPVLHVDKEPMFGLVHLGDNEFRFTGWSEERTITLERNHVICRTRLGTSVLNTICLAESL